MPDQKPWNWQQDDWPHFSWDRAALDPLEAGFLRASGILIGTFRHIGEEEKTTLTVHVLGAEALDTAAIEGEQLERDSLQSSLRRQFGLETDNRKIPPAEQGLAEMTTSLYRSFDAALSDESLHRWHAMLMNGRRDLQTIGGYRIHAGPMRIVSGRIDEPRVHFEAPPSRAIPVEMERFIAWFNRSAPQGPAPLPALTRAGIAHLYFESIHPYEDGNGRIGRALAEKALSQSLGQPTLIALSRAIKAGQRAYYAALERASRHNEITTWLVSFAETVLEAQRLSQQTVDLSIAKARFFEKYRGRLNPRQEKVLARLFREEPEGFKGGLSAENYLRLTGTSRATATRDLQELVTIRALRKTGALKGTRYHLTREE